MSFPAFYVVLLVRRTGLALVLSLLISCFGDVPGFCFVPNSFSDNRFSIRWVFVLPGLNACSSECVSGFLHLRAWAGTIEPASPTCERSAKRPVRIMIRAKPSCHLQEPACQE